jgi:hypothetical protein
MKSQFARLRINGKTCLAKIVSENDKFLHFRKVNRFGDEIEESYSGGYHIINEHLVAKELITRRTEMKMSLVYAELEPN